MVLYRLDSTVPVTMDMMVAHGAAVMRGSKHACVIVDMPFGSYQESPALAFRHAAYPGGDRLRGCEAGRRYRNGGDDPFLTDRGIPVCGHIGLMPQAVNASGYRVQGRTAEEAARVTKDASAVAAAGAFGVVIESTYRSLADAITQSIPIPTIGIGASPACDDKCWWWTTWWGCSPTSRRVS